MHRRVDARASLTAVYIQDCIRRYDIIGASVLLRRARDLLDEGKDIISRMSRRMLSKFMGTFRHVLLLMHDEGDVQST